MIHRNRAALSWAQRRARNGLSTDRHLTRRETGSASVRNAAGIRGPLTTISRAGSSDANHCLWQGTLIGEIHAGQGLARCQCEGLGAALGHIATDVRAILSVRTAILVRPAILVISVLPVLTAVAGSPPIHPVAALAMLISIILIPTLLAAGIQTVIGVRSRSLNTIRRLGNAYRIRARIQAVEAIVTISVGAISLDGNALSVFKSDEHIANS